MLPLRAAAIVSFCARLSVALMLLPAFRQGEQQAAIATFLHGARRGS
jgi:hypothetical protein